MVILTLRTDKPEAEIGFFENQKQIDYFTWHAHRTLAETLHSQLEALLKKNNATWQSIEGIAVYEGPGSFTGLRIGITMANSLAYSLGIKVASASGDNWIATAQANLLNGKAQIMAIPQYGAEPHITQQKK